MSLLTRTVKDQLNAEDDSKSNQKLVAEIVELSDKVKELATPGQRKRLFAKSNKVKTNADLKAFLAGIIKSYGPGGQFRGNSLDHWRALPKWFTDELTVPLKDILDDISNNDHHKASDISVLINKIGKVSTVSERKPFFEKISKVKTSSAMENFLKVMLKALSTDEK
jgi:hypothetical protein